MESYIIKIIEAILRENDFEQGCILLTWGYRTFWVIGQNVLVKTAVVVEVSTATAVISFLKEDTGWTKRVGKIV